MAQDNLNKKFNWGLMMIFVTAFQLLTSTAAILKNGESVNMNLVIIFVAYIGLEWIYFTFSSNIFGQNNFELEIIAFLFSGISLTIVASVYPGESMTFKQLLSIVLGLAVFIVMLCVLRRTDIVMKLRMPVAAAALGLLALNLLLAKVNNGALNWITIADVVSIQPSEIVKLAFIFVGAASLDKLQSSKSLTKYLIFSFTCVGSLFLMRDFGTALIFFFTFIIIAFMRSGDVRTIALVCVAAALGAIMIIYFRPTVASRFSTYRHVWEHINESGMQQSRVLIYSVSGGLFGLGIGEGKLKAVFASTTDLVFGMLCEEWGIIVAILVVLCYAFILFYAIRVARTTRSAFYAIAACAAAGLILFQTGLNIFGVTDILPLTGVTLPFISRGGSSMICSWGLIAFIKSADIRTYPKLSQTILPDHPLYPPDIRIGRRNVNGQQNGRPQTRRSSNPMMPIPPEMKTEASPKRPAKQAENVPADIPISRPKRAAGTAQNTSAAGTQRKAPVQSKPTQRKTTAATAQRKTTSARSTQPTTARRSQAQSRTTSSDRRTPR
ncbi:MAG: FtsW/RodA/SpoVE family cell cycle protein [Clostridia bacterium]|nr:FtsW/RodA/SpoVE family cell cycle protein [Clostridia bacterium]